jgi:phosphoglycolate phosphatase-like HAD superfamily hydrolase
VSLIAGQELGNKKIQLALGSHDKYPVEKILMIGDAPGDLESARAVGASFYPIIPGKEEESWIYLREEVLSSFFAGTYRGAYEERIIERFFESLKGK